MGWVGESLKRIKNHPHERFIDQKSWVLPFFMEPANKKVVYILSAFLNIWSFEFYFVLFISVFVA